MTFYKIFIPNGEKTEVSKDEACSMIINKYRNLGLERALTDLMKKKIIGMGWYWNLIYEPKPENYCYEQGCESDKKTCGYYPSECMKWKYGVE